MAAPTPSDFDLLQERRLELGLPRLPAPVPSARSMLLRGGLVGAVFVLAAVGAALGVGGQVAEQQQQLERLQPIEQRVQGTEARLKQQKTRSGAMQQENLRIAEQLVAIQSGSALLEQLRRITPQGIQLTEVTVNPGRIELAGKARAAGRPDGFERINALMLNLSALPMANHDAVKVIKVTREQSGNDQAETALLSFTIQVPLNPGFRASEAQLRQLGAKGLADRHQLLRQHGVEL
ncbi:MAG: PilN domain-containing protein [Prochlorococcus sp.]|nr:PilN domain-containing protein [Prochlorococcaceae cyanobacterium Fu_MAG_50]